MAESLKTGFHHVALRVPNFDAVSYTHLDCCISSSKI